MIDNDSTTGDQNTMKFDRKNFNYHGGYLMYGDKFVARFKHMRSNKPGFLSFLIKNFSPAEYFERYDAGESPHGILKSKGYVADSIKKWLRDGGYEVSVAGYEKFVADQVNFRMEGDQK